MKFSASQKTLCVPIIKTNWLMEFKELHAAYSEYLVRHKFTLLEKMSK
jgi:hypothetical protein